MDPTDPDESTAPHGAALLAVGLQRIAADPDWTLHLHEILGTYCHNCRNLLHNLKLCMYLATRGGECAGAENGLGGKAWGELETTYQELEHFVDRIHQLCRPTDLETMRASLDLLVEDRREEWSRLLSARGRTLVVERWGDDPVGAFDPMRLAPTLDELVAWRAFQGASDAALRLNYGVDGGMLVMEWEEGPIRPIRRRASTSTAQAKTHRPAGGSEAEVIASEAYHALTLPLLTRVVVLHGGMLEAADSDAWRVRLSWPADPQPG
jgi:hypothetical protein